MRIRSIVSAVVSVHLLGCSSAPDLTMQIDSARECERSQRIRTPDDEWIVADCYSGAEPAIVLIHGWSQSRVVWAKQIAALAGTRKLITYDLRGHGDSARSDDPNFYLEQWTPARDLEAVLNGFGVSQAVVVGWSFGSVVAANSAVYLGATRIPRLVLVSGTTESATPRNAANFGPLFAALGAMTEDSEIELERAAVHRFLSQSYRAGSWPRDLYHMVFEANMRLTSAERSVVAQRPEQYFANDLVRLGVPVLLIHGAEDPVFSARSSRQAHAELPNSDLLIYEATGHWPFIEQASRFNADVLRFVDAEAEERGIASPP